MLTSSSVGDQDWDDQALSSDEEENKQQNPTDGTVFQNNQTAKSIKWTHLNDLFEYPNHNRLSAIFTKPDDNDAIKAKDLFSSRHDTLTRKKLKGIIDSIDTTSKNVWNWPEKQKAESLEPLDSGESRNLSSPRDEINLDVGNNLKELNELKIETLDVKQSRRPKSAPKSKGLSTPIASQNNENIEKVDIRESGCLDLTSCHLASISDRKMEGEIYTKFKLNNNSLEFLDEVDVTAQLLQISYNCISDMTSFSHLQSLSSLDISHNGLTDLSALSGLFSLKELKATHNKFVDILPLRHLLNLVDIDLNGNLIECLDFVKSSLPRLYSLSVADNRISRISNLNHLENLHELLIGCSLFNLDNNKLAEFEVLKPMKRLKILNLSDNLLTSFNGFQFPALGVLQLDRNRIFEVKGNFVGLDVCSLADQVSTCLNLKLGKVFECDEVRLCGNKNLKWEFDTCAKFESFDASYCLLPAIPSPVFNSLNMRNLSLPFNQISDLSPIKPLKNLRVLLLSNNLLKDLHTFSEIVKGFPYLSILDITNNLFISSDADKAQVEVSEIVMNTCVLLSCKHLKTFNRLSVSPIDRKRAVKRMGHLKEIAKQFAQKSNNEFFDGWKPELQPLEDMTAGEDLVLEVL